MHSDTLHVPSLGQGPLSPGTLRHTRTRAVFRLARANRGGVLGLLLLVGLVVIAFMAPLISPADPTEIDLSRRLQAPTGLAAGTQAHPFGTDDLGRDVFSRTLYGARTSLSVGALAMLVAGTLGVMMGLTAGYLRGKVDSIIMSLSDIQQSFPFIALAIAVVAVLGPGTRNTTLVLGIGGWTLFARVVRGEVLSVREKEFVQAARAVGARDLRIMFRHILPNIMSPIIVMASFTFSQMLITEASLSFIGLGVQPPEFSWGLMLSEARDFLDVAWWSAAFPGLAIMLTALGANLLGDALRDVLDPRLKNTN